MNKKIIIPAVISLLVLLPFGQMKAKKDSLILNAPIIKVTLLGTGTPMPIMDRFGPSILVQAGPRKFII